MSKTGSSVVHASGKVVFPSHASVTYHYDLTEHAFTLEHLVNEQQWEGSILNGLAGASVDPATISQCLVTALAKLQTKTASENQHVDITSLDEETTELKLCVRFSSGGIVWTPTFCFKLKQRKMSETEVLRAKLRDMQQRVNELEAQKIVTCDKLAQAPVLAQGLRGERARERLKGIYEWVVDACLAVVLVARGLARDAVDRIVVWWKWIKRQAQGCSDSIFVQYSYM
ncbi:hypothetical protein Poli38472_013648 [Pythium oligandrum]|uniref:Uncharacterized protein n=1 Tax=Pythium oligandrum TaxID=41045 RepID=A0A8K1FF26_PYTOL|nr:hypothetical protein Poli38472_013648 [Pythium oligandrum]|eukprot:TMW61185.1 hypothetical protein Poli38472_013648 [Pythium oligandrum]